MVDEKKFELPEDQIIIGEREFELAINEVISRAQHEILIFGNQLSKGGYASITRHEILREFLSRGSPVSLQIILHEIDDFSQQYPRLFSLLQDYTHLMTVYQTNDQAKVAKDAFIIVDQSHYVRRFHMEQARFRYAFNDLETVAMLKMRFDELLESTSHKLSSSSLGL